MGIASRSRTTPGLRATVVWRAKCAGMVRRSWLTSTRPASAAICKTSGSATPSSPASVAVRISISGATRRKPRTMRPSRSASAWNLTRITRTLQLRDQFRIRLPRLLMLRFSGMLPIRKVRVDLSLIRQVERKRTMHLLEAQGRVALNHALGRHPLTEQIDQRIKGDPSVSYSICAFDALYIFLRHMTTAFPCSHVGPYGARPAVWLTPHSACSSTLCWLVVFPSRLLNSLKTRVEKMVNPPSTKNPEWMP